jgi:hypothetical protein
MAFAELVIKVSVANHGKLTLIRDELSRESDHKLTFNEVVTELVRSFEQASALMRDIRTTS